MNESEWDESCDPRAMIRWLETQGYSDALWDFTIACCRRLWDDLPGESFRRVVEHFEQLGIRDIEGPLSEASQSLDKLERRLRESTSAGEQTRLNREVGLGRMVFAFEYQDAVEAARSISDDQFAWADDPMEERQFQAALLRRLVPDPTKPIDLDEDV